MSLSIRTYVVSPFQQNARVLQDLSTKTSVLVDPGDEAPRLLAAATQDGYQLESIFLTHSHIDHAGGLKVLLDHCDHIGLAKPPVYGHRLGKPVRQSIEMQCQMFGIPPGTFYNVPEPDVYLDEGDTFSVGSLSGQIRFVPGHSPGHIVLYFDALEAVVDDEASHAPLLIAGDTLFRESIGRTDLPGGDHATLLTHIREKLFTLPDETVVMPGHGPNTTIGHEKKFNPFLTM